MKQKLLPLLLLIALSGTALVYVSPTARVRGRPITVKVPWDGDKCKLSRSLVMRLSSTMIRTLLW